MQDYSLLIKQSQTNLITVGDFTRLSVSLFKKNELFFGHGCIDSQQEAHYLIAHILGIELELLPTYFNCKLLSPEIEQITEALTLRIQNRMPVAYIIKQAICQGYQFYIDERAIIPRSFIAEILVNNTLEPFIPYTELVTNVLDLCTGNGSLAIIASDVFPEAQLVASDISPGALEVATINVNDYALTNRIHLIQSDLFSQLPKQKFDLILTNPPYVDTLRMTQLTDEYQHEPALALAGGDSGLDLVKQIILEATNYLTEDGVLVLEMGDNISEFNQTFPGIPVTWLETISGDSFVFAITKSSLDEYFS